VQSSTRSKMTASFLATALAIGLPIMFLLYTVWVAPRPYFIREMDLEPDYYYNSLLLYKGLAVAGSHHPGTPIYYLGALLLGATGGDFARAQSFFNLAYIVIALFTCAALVMLVRWLLREVPLGLSMLAVAMILVWPPTLTYLNHFGSESFIVPFGLPTLAVFWMAMSSSGKSQTRLLLAAGLGAGLCLATKMTFLPVAAALVVVTLLAAVVAGWSGRNETLMHGRLTGLVTRGTPAIVLLLGILVGFGAMTAPILSRLPRLLYETLMRPEARPAGNVAVEAARVYGHLYDANPALAITVLVLFVLFSVAALTNAGEWLRTRRAQPGGADAARAERQVVLGAFLAIMAAAFVYCLASSSSVITGYDAGIGLRNVSPSFLFIPFMLVYVWRTLSERVHLSAGGRRGLQIAIAGLAIIVVAIGLNNHLGHRREFIRFQQQEMTLLRAHLDSFRKPGERIAFWNGVSNDLVGDEASFHFLGDLTYAYGQFDRDLLARYETYTICDASYATRDTDTGKAIETNDGSSASRPASRYGSLGNLAWRLIGRSGPYVDHPRVFVGDDAGIQLSAIVVPEDQLVKLATKQRSQDRSVTSDEVLHRLSVETAASEVTRMQVGGVEYVVLQPTAVRPSD
jgi:hypothetical protein